MTTKVYGFDLFPLCHDMTEILLKVALNTINHKPPVMMNFGDTCFSIWFLTKT